MGKQVIIIERDDLDFETENKIKSNLSRIATALDNLAEMGFNMYLAPNALNVCDGDTHKGSAAHADQSVIVATVYVKGIDAGDW